MAKEKISVITLGCSKNTVDSERLMQQITLNRMELTDDPAQADTVIINTCGFIEAAKEESVNTILEAVKAKDAGTVKKILVAGCLSERYAEDLKLEIPEVDGFFGTEDYSGIISKLGGELKTELLGERYLTTPHHTAYLKISEGCDNPCSFCAIPLMRGKHQSRPFGALLQEARFLAAQGTKELVIIGQDTTDYGLDITGQRIIAQLLRALSEIEGIEWIRLMYAYPSHFPDDLIDEMANNPKICKYLDIPLQHISDRCLKSMRRGITKRRTVELMDTLRSRIPGIVLRTTFIVGYPAEQKEDFEELCEFVKEARFERMGVFTYSVEENTPAFILGDTISEKEKNRRKNVLMELQREISGEFNAELIGVSMPVLIDAIEGEYYVARSLRDAPEVDCEVLIPVSDGEVAIGSIVTVTVYDAEEYDLFANLNK